MLGTLALANSGLSLLVSSAPRYSDPLGLSAGASTAYQYLLHSSIFLAMPVRFRTSCNSNRPRYRCLGYSTVRVPCCTYVQL